MLSLMPMQWLIVQLKQFSNCENDLINFDEIRYGCSLIQLFDLNILWKKIHFNDSVVLIENWCDNGNDNEEDKTISTNGIKTNPKIIMIIPKLNRTQNIPRIVPFIGK